MARPYRRKGTKFWWISPWIAGRQVPQSSGETDYDRADRKLKILEGKIAANAPITPRTDRDSFAALLEVVKTDYKIKNRATKDDIVRWMDLHIVPHLGSMPTAKVTAAVLAEYIATRQSEKASNGTINRELTLIKRAFRLGLRSGNVSYLPHVELLPEAEPRGGFFTEEGFRSILAHTDRQELKDILVCCYYTGWRIESVIALEWRNVDFARGLVGLRREQTKNRKATAFPLAAFPELLGMLARRRDDTKRIEREKSCVIARVFHREGEPVINIRTAWHGARCRAGLPGRLLHDFRRTAVRNLVQMGYPTVVIKTMVGIKTDSMFQRYSIITEDDVLRFAERLKVHDAHIPESQPKSS